MTTMELITDDEAALYDRQIRLWGVEAQNRLRNSSVLLAGLSGTGAEIAKNLMLVGLKSLTLLDHNTVSECDQDAQFLIPADSFGRNRAEASRTRTERLNPMVHLMVDSDTLESKEADFFKRFDLVCLVNQSCDQIERVNEICRKLGVKMCASGVYGWFGYGFSDFLEHEFVEEVDNEVAETAERAETQTSASGAVTQKMQFRSWSDAMNVEWSRKVVIKDRRKSECLLALKATYFVVRYFMKKRKTGETEPSVEDMSAAWKDIVVLCGLDPADWQHQLEDVVEFVSGELSPVCAIVGGVVAQEIIKALSRKDRPLQNLFLYSGTDTNGIVCKLPPQ